MDEMSSEEAGSNWNLCRSPLICCCRTNGDDDDVEKLCQIPIGREDIFLSSFADCSYDWRLLHFLHVYPQSQTIIATATATTAAAPMDRLTAKVSGVKNNDDEGGGL